MTADIKRHHFQQDRLSVTMGDSKLNGTLVTPTPEKKNQELSVYMTVTLIFVTHGLINSLLLAPWNGIRCAYWNQPQCSKDEDWMLNWLAFGQFHVFVLMACLAQSARGHILLEQRLMYLSATIIISYLSTGVFMIEFLNKPMAAVQLLVYLILLTVIIHHTATAPPVVPLPALLRSSSFDARKRLPISTVAVVVQFVLSLFQITDMTFGEGRDGYLGDNSSLVYQSMSGAACQQMLWVSLILGGSVLLANENQHKRLLTGQALVLFISQIMLAGSQGAKIEESQVKAGGVATFFSIALSLVGAV